MTHPEPLTPDTPVAPPKKVQPSVTAEETDEALDAIEFNLGDKKDVETIRARLAWQDKRIAELEEKLAVKQQMFAETLNRALNAEEKIPSWKNIEKTQRGTFICSDGDNIGTAHYYALDGCFVWDGYAHGFKPPKYWLEIKGMTLPDKASLAPISQTAQAGKKLASEGEKDE